MAEKPNPNAYLNRPPMNRGQGTSFTVGGEKPQHTVIPPDMQCPHCFKRAPKNWKICEHCNKPIPGR